MLSVRDTVGLVVDHRLIAVEGQTVVHIALDGVGGDQLYVRGPALDLAGEGAGGGVDIKLFAIEAEDEDKAADDRDQSRVAYLRDAPAANDEEDKGAEEDCGGGGDHQPLCGGDERLVLHVLGGEDEDKDHDSTEFGVGPEQPFGQSLAADAVEVVG